MLAGDYQGRSIGEWLADACKVCESPFDEAKLLMCGNTACEKMYHTYCLEPPLEGIPEEDWYCPECVEAGLTAD